MNINLSTWAAVGEALPGTWSVDHLASREDVALLREDGLQLVVLESWDTPEGKVTIRLTINGDEWEHKLSYETVPAINVNPGRKAEDLAKDIERRLIPVAEEFRQYILERVTQANERRRREDALREQLLATGAVDQPDRHPLDRLYLKQGAGRNGYITPYGDRVRFDLYLSAEDAVQVLALLAERAAK